MISGTLLLAAAFAAALLVSFFFSGSETAVVSANRYRLAHLRKQGDAGAEKTLALLSRSPRLLSAVLIGTNLGNVFAVLLFKALLDRFWDRAAEPAVGFVRWDELISLLAFTPMLVIFAEILPKALFRARADAWIMPLRTPLAVVTLLLMPVIVVLEALVNLVLVPMRRGSALPKRRLTRADLILMLHGTGQADELDQFESEGRGAGEAAGNGVEGARSAETPDLIREPDERRLIQNIIALEQTFAREVMQPLVEVEAVRLGQTTVEAFRERAKRSGYSRFPVFRNRITNLIGYIDIYDVIRDTENRTDLESFVHPAYYVPETKRLDDLLREFLVLKINNAIVVDEYGGCSGWITREDIIEEIVGELDDELDEPSEQIAEIEGGYRVDGRIDLEELNEVFSLSLDDSECDTLAGLIMMELDSIPKVGDTVELEGWRMTVTEMEGHRVAWVEMRPVEPA
jgi:putative hemolysin